MELDTPNLGSPLANMVAEAYMNTPLGNLIGNARAYGIGDVINPQIRWLLSELNQPGGPLATSASGSGLVNPFFVDAGVDSTRLSQLNAIPFRNDVGYASIVGTQTTIQVVIAGHATPIWINPFQAFQPMWNPKDYFGDGDQQVSASYFPWLYTFNSAPGATDDVVPVWSQALGIPAYSPQFDVNHQNVYNTAAVQQQVLAFLNDPNVPLGSAQRAAWNNQPPVSQRNAYAPTTILPNGQSTGGGLNPAAVVAVQFQATGYSPATWDTSPANVGIKVPILTGMIPYGNRTGEQFQILTENHNLLYQSVGLPSPNIAIALDQISGAKDSDWVAFTLTPAGGIGRMQAQALTGPSGNGTIRAADGVIYKMSDLPGSYSPAVAINLPPFALPAMTHEGLTVHSTGAVEWAGSNAASQTIVVDLYSKNTVVDTNLAALSVVVPNPGQGAWNGVLVPYSVSFVLFTDSRGDVYGPDGNSEKTSPSIYQWLIDSLASNYASPPITVP